jgi:putative protease
MEKKKIGIIEHFYGGISVAVVKLDASLKKGDMISIEGPTTNVQQKAESMQIDRKEIAEAKKGQSIGMKVSDKVKQNDIVYKV